MRKFSGVLQHSGCRRRRLAVNARAVCTFGARRARFVTTRKPLIPWHTSSWTAEYFKYSWHEVVAHRSGCAARSRIPSSGRAYLPDSDDSDDDDERLKTFEALNVTTATAQQPPLLPRGLASKDPHHFSLFFSFLSFFLSFSNRRSTTRPSNEIPSKGISNLSHEDKPLLRSSWNIDRYVSKTDRTGLVAFLCIDFFKHLIKIYMYIQCYVLFLCFEIFFFFGKFSANVQSLFRSNLLYAENIFVFDSQH